MCARRNSGFTIIELIVFIVIIGVGLAGILTVYDTVTRRSADPVRAKQALAVAEGMMDEILNKNLCDPDTETPANAATSTSAICVGNVTEASRDLFDDVDDYITYPANSAVTDVTSGSTVLTGYTVTVNVTNPAANFVVAGAQNVPSNDYRIVTVTVKDTVSNQSYDITGYKFNND